MHQLTANNSSASCTFGSVRAWLPEPHPIIQVDLHVEHATEHEQDECPQRPMDVKMESLVRKVE